MKLSTFSMHLPALIVASLAPTVMSQKGEVYLTFDDGPIDATFGVLDVLAEMDTKATFFLNAFHCFGEGDENEDNATSALKRTVEDGHVIANHSYNHMLHNCCNDDGECGAEVCNQIAMWNVRAYQDVKTEEDLFHLNTKVLRQLLKSQNKGEALSNDKLDSLGRLPYTNAYRLDDTNIDCPCCTSDDVPIWHADATCTIEAPHRSATISALVADELKSSGMDLHGWDLEWGPENWGADDPAASLTSAEDLAKTVMELATTDTCTAHLDKSIVAYCDPDSHWGKVNILTHDFLFEDGNRGSGATENLPKLREFIRLMKSEGFVFKTVDQYGQSRIRREEADHSKLGKSSKSSKSAKSSKSSKSARSSGPLFGKGSKRLR